jgi:hypothetical protein
LLSRELMEHPEMEKMLKKHVAATTLRNLDKILTQIKTGGSQSGKTSSRSRTSRMTL